MSIQVNDFKHIPGKNDAEYIRLLEEALKRERQITSKAIVKIKRLSKRLETSSVWTPCSERLPKYGKTVLITNNKGNVSYGRFRGVEFWKEDGDSLWTWKNNTIEHVVAWMPKPQPYKENADESD